MRRLSRSIDQTVSLYCEGSGGPGAGWYMKAEWVPKKTGGYRLWSWLEGPSGYRKTRLKDAKRPLSRHVICRDILRFPQLRVGVDLRDDVEVAGLKDFESDIVIWTCALDDDNPPPDWTYVAMQSDQVLEKLRSWLGPLYGELAVARIQAFTELCTNLGLPENLEAAGRKVSWTLDKPAHQLLARMLRLWRATGHDISWSQLRPGDQRVLDWIDDKVLGPRTLDEWMFVLESWVKHSGTTDRDPAAELESILVRFEADRAMYKAATQSTPLLVKRFRKKALEAVLQRYTPGKPSPSPGPFGVVIIAWRRWKNLYLLLNSPPWTADAISSK